MPPRFAAGPLCGRCKKAAAEADRLANDMAEQAAADERIREQEVAAALDEQRQKDLVKQEQAAKTDSMTRQLEARKASEAMVIRQMQRTAIWCSDPVAVPPQNQSSPTMEASKRSA